MTLAVRLKKKLPHFTLDVEFSCPAGKLLAVTGPSVSGKTTVLRMLAGLDDPDTGRITLGDEVWRDTASGVRICARRRGVGLVFQEYSLFPHMTLAQNVAYATADAAFGAHLLELFGIAHLAGSRPGASDSGGPCARPWREGPRHYCSTSPFPPWTPPRAPRFAANCSPCASDSPFPLCT